MPLPRLRLRTLMIAVALAAAILYGFSLNRLSQRYRARADRIRLQRPDYQEREGLVQGWRENMQWSEQLEQKYRDAAAHPWLPVPPDPPMPK